MRSRRGMQRIPELDGFRVLFVFIVSLFHIWQQSWLKPELFGSNVEFLARAGYVCVDATILLSGFLLFLPWVVSPGPPETIGRFYRKRAARILPSFYFVTLFMLFAYALPQHLYEVSWRPPLWKDLLTHFTLTFPFFEDTYQTTPLGGSSWTIAIEVHFYLLFPFIARAAKKHPGWVIGGMAAAGAYFRAWCLWTQDSYEMVLNQMANFLDVYALGMACALLWPRLAALRDDMRQRGKSWQAILQTVATIFLVISVTGWLLLMKHQAGIYDYPSLYRSQMMLRPVFALCFAGMLLSLPLCAWPIRKLFGNPVTRFLSLISMNYYLLHQNIAVLLKTDRVREWLEKPRDWLGGEPILYSPYANPNQTGDHAWQVRYTWLAFGLSLAAAILVTYLIEKPFARLILHRRKQKTQSPDRNLPNPFEERRDPDETPDRLAAVPAVLPAPDSDG
ncbi:MAG: acyltransferase [Clostridia bacterium]|nr:acyltransferase [Clostridia bacterium]